MSNEKANNFDFLTDVVTNTQEDKSLRAIITDIDNKCFRPYMNRPGYEDISYLFGRSIASKVKKIVYYEDLDDSPAKSYKKGTQWFIIVNPTLEKGNQKMLRAILLHEMAHICVEGEEKVVRNKKTGEALDNHDGHLGLFDKVLKAIKRCYGEKALIAPPGQFHGVDGIRVDGNNEVSRNFPKWGSRMNRMDFYQRQADKGNISLKKATDRYRSDVLNKKYGSIVTENYDRVDGKLVKNEANYYHYTSTANFHNIAASLAYGDGIRGTFYPTRLNHTYGGKSSNEVCFVRSDKIPDRSEFSYMSGSVGDIKFTFKENKLQNKFGKIKPIQEYPIQYREYIANSIQEAKKELGKNTEAIKSLDEIGKRYHQLSIEEVNALLKKASSFATTREALKALKEVQSNIEEYKDVRNAEHMESRVRVPQGKFITLDLIDKIMLPDYLKDNKEVLADVQKLRTKGFNNVVYYRCKWPKDCDEQIKRRREEIEKYS